MLKSKVILLTTILLFSFSLTGFAQTIFAGSVAAGEMPNVFLASQTDLTDYWEALTVSGSGSIVWYSYKSDGTKDELGRSNTPGTNIKAPTGANAFLLLSNGGSVYAVEGWTTNTNGDHVLFETPNSDSDPFSSPEWDDHMQKLDEILNAIPPAPDWNQVAGTFRDTILPKLKSDLQEVLGTAPSPPTSIDAPSVPSRPSAPDIANEGNLNNGGLTEPTGSNAPGLDSSGFSADDIKDGAPAIEERSDPTGGFTINNPLSGLPSQDEFMQNIPGNPDVPNVTEPQIGQEPTFKEPSLGKEPTYTMPTFNEPTYSMPTFTEPTYKMPTFTQPTFNMPTFTSPNINYNTAPTPTQGTTTTAPLTGEYNSAPIPNETLTPPLPGG